jgi:hypothetical protein
MQAIAAASAHTVAMGRGKGGLLGPRSTAYGVS